jgi:hypothetical protein
MVWPWDLVVWVYVGMYVGRQVVGCRVSVWARRHGRDRAQGHKG